MVEGRSSCICCPPSFCLLSLPQKSSTVSRFHPLSWLYPERYATRLSVFWYLNYDLNASQVLVYSPVMVEFIVIIEASDSGCWHGAKLQLTGGLAVSQISVSSSKQVILVVTIWGLGQWWEFFGYDAQLRLTLSFVFQNTKPTKYGCCQLGCIIIKASDSLLLPCYELRTRPMKRVSSGMMLSSGWLVLLSEYPMFRVLVIKVRFSLVTIWSRSQWWKPLGHDAQLWLVLCSCLSVHPVLGLIIKASDPLLCYDPRLRPMMSLAGMMLRSGWPFSSLLSGYLQRCDPS